MMMRGYPPAGDDPAALVERHMDLTRRIAWHVHGRTGQRSDIRDLLQVAHIALVEAARRHVPQPGVPFASYAAIRIRGALIDHLRAQSGQSRSSLRMRRRLAEGISTLQQRLMRSPSDAELADHLDLDPAELARWQAEGDIRVDSLDEVYSDHSDCFRDISPGAEALILQKERLASLRDAIARLPEREALVLQLYFVEEMNVYEVAEVLKVTTGRVSQIKTAAVGRLRALMAETGDAA
ncbi:sigma-70 family RNA polymerase sigma factor [Frigidibacter oleivorans]|uniref:sigma-70 family RNA polymerase sigma factor n=1 Tax=Frigidibacter oleivorans TaxID=2487129 RepID=UPI0013DF89FA|nr:sigma-70 family RNA polymerase sigma factor [Frigidibacter oleivorans]